MTNDAADGPLVLVYGGTFDPPHRAHVDLPRAAAETLEASKILYIPTGRNPLKSDAPSAGRHRLAMLAIALRDVPEAEISTVEVYREQACFTADTLAELDAIRPGSERRRLLIGADQAAVFHQWRRWETIIELAPPAIMLRAPWSRASLIEHWTEVHGETDAARWAGWIVDTPLMDAAATSIRSGDAGDELDPAVASYIEAAGLYG